MMRPNAPRFLSAALLLLFLGGIAGCEKKLETITLDLAGTPFIVEVADTPETQARGLMYRKELAENRGMLFVFDRDRHPSFWMKNTEIPLSLAYIAKDGEIKEIFDLIPGSLRQVDSNFAVRYALEVNRGAFERLGIGPGYRIKLPEPLAGANR